MTDAPESPENQRPEARERAINLHGVVLALIGLLVAIHLARTLVLNEQTDAELGLWLAFVPLRIIAGQQDPGYWLPLAWTPFTYALLHAGWMHLIFNCVWLAAFGTPVAQRYGATKFLLLFFITSACGAALFAVIPTGGALVGASGGIAGLTGAAVRFIFQPLLVHRDPETGEPRMLGRKLASFSDLVRDRRAGVFTLIWLAGNAVVPLLPGVFGGDGNIAWQAHLGGFLAGLLLVPMLERRRQREVV